MRDSVNRAAALAKRYGPALLVAALLAALIGSGLLRHLSLEDLRAHRAQLLSMVGLHPVISLAVFVGLFAAVVISCAPGPGVLAMASGFLFGPWLGGAASLLSCLVGSSVLFLACRTALGDVLMRKAGPRVRGMAQRFGHGAFGYLLTLRLIPAVPFFVPTVAAAAAHTRLSTLAGATAIGSAPSLLILASLGHGLGVLFESGRPVTLATFETPAVVLPLAGLALLSAAPIGWRLARRRLAARRAAAR